jgi:hypothetical protein
MVRQHARGDRETVAVKDGLPAITRVFATLRASVPQPHVVAMFSRI